MKEVEINLDGTGLRIGIVQSRFNPVIGEGLLGACRAELVKHGVQEEDIVLLTVPGALEIPLALIYLADAEHEEYQCDALIAMGAVIRGDTYHFEVVATESAHGIAKVQLDRGIPVVNAVLTTDSEEQAEARMNEKGEEAARVAIEMVNLQMMAYEWQE
jgi:6,7-dimethyl-8-ribityllumazine synthase